MSIANRVNEVMKKVGVIPKDRKTESGPRYNYLSEDAQTAELHQAFTDAGLIIIPMAMEILDNRESKTSNGNVLITSRILVTYQLREIDGDDTALAQAIGEGSDTGDKVVNKCMTAAYKYVLRETCMISTGDDPDHTSSESQAKAGGKRNGGNGEANRQQPAVDPMAAVRALLQQAAKIAATRFGSGDAGRAKYLSWVADTLGCLYEEIKTPAQAQKLLAGLAALPEHANGNGATPGA